MKFYFIHKSFNSLSSAYELLKINRSKYNLEQSPTEPDILIASERIYNYKPCLKNLRTSEKPVHCVETNKLY